MLKKLVFLLGIMAISYAGMAWADTTIDIVQGSLNPKCTETKCYDPTDAIVQVGTKVTWINKDDPIHTVISGTPKGGATGIFDSGVITNGNNFSYTFNEYGEYPYYCMLHPWAVGTVYVVKEIPICKDDEIIGVINRTATCVINPYKIKIPEKSDEIKLTNASQTIIIENKTDNHIDTIEPVEIQPDPIPAPKPIDNEISVDSSTIILDPDRKSINIIYDTIRHISSDKVKLKIETRLISNPKILVIDGIETKFTKTNDGTYTTIEFIKPSNNIKLITLYGSHVIPEFDFEKTLMALPTIAIAIFFIIRMKPWAYDYP